jgi:signal transduction histidine kinase
MDSHPTIMHAASGEALSSRVTDHPETLSKLIGPFAREIRTPMASLLASSEILVEEIETYHRCSGYARLIRDVSGRLNETLLDLAALALPMKLTPKSFDLSLFLQARITQLRAWAEQQGVWLVTHLPGGAIPVLADEDALRLAVTRLMDYQIEAMDGSGTFEISLERISHERVHILLSDSGPTVPNEQFDKIFEPYFATEGRHPGMVLALVRRIIEEQGGRVNAWPNRHGGVTFELRLRIADSDAAPASNKKGNSYDGYQAERN